MAGNIKGITIEFSGNTTKLDKAITDAENKSKRLDNELRNINKALRFNPKSIELWQQKQQVLTQKVEETRTKLEALRKKQAEMSKAGVDKNSEEWRTVQREIIETESKLKHFEGELKKVNNYKIDQLGGQFEKIGKKISSVGDSLTKKVTVPIIALGTASFAAFKDVDKGLDAVAKKTGATGDDLKAMQESVKNLGTEVPASFEEIGNAVGEVNTRFGVTGQDLDDLSAKFLKFAKVNDTDVTASIDSTQKVLAAFGMDASEAGNLLDVFTAVGQRTGLSMDTLTNLMIKNGAQLQAMGLDAAQAANFLGDMEVSGMDVTQSMQAMQKALKYAAKEGKALPEVLSDFDEIMKSNLSETEKLNKAYEIFGTKSGAAMYNAAKNGTVAFDQLGKSIDDNLGTLDRTFGNTLDAGDQMKLTFNALKEAAAEIGAALGSVLVPMLKKAAEGLKRFAKWFNQLSPKTKELITKIGMLAAAAGPILSIVGRLTSGLGGLIKKVPSLISGAGKIAKVLVANPYLAVAAAAAAAAGAIAYLAWHHNKIIRDYEKSKAAREEEISGVYAQAQTAEIYAQKLEALSQKENKSAADKQLMKTYVDQLNGSVEGLNLQYDAEADKLNQSTAEIYKKIDAYKQQAVAQAYQNQMQQVANELVQTEMELDEVRTAKAEANARLRTASNEAEMLQFQADVDELENKERQLTDKQNGLMQELDTYAQKASGDVKQIGTDLKDTATTAGTEGANIGKNLAAGVANGLSAGQTIVKNAAIAVVNKAVEAMKNAGLIESPSKLTRDLIGKNLGLGVAEGLTASLGAVESDARGFMKGTVNAMLATPPQMQVAGMSTVAARIGTAQSAPAGGRNVSQTINIYQPVSTPAETARAIRQQEIILGLAG